MTGHYIEPQSYLYDSDTRSIIVFISDLSVVSENPILVTNHVTSGEQLFRYRSRTETEVLFESSDIPGLTLKFNISPQTGSIPYICND